MTKLSHTDENGNVVAVEDAEDADSDDDDLQMMVEGGAFAVPVSVDKETGAMQAKKLKDVDNPLKEVMQVVVLHLACEIKAETVRGYHVFETAGREAIGRKYAQIAK